jgi:hypothetical protein
MLVLGNRIGVVDYTVNPDGYWVLLDKTTAEKYCFNTDHEAWSLAIGPNNVLYLGNVTGTEKDNVPQVSNESEPLRLCKKGFDFTYSGSPNPPEPNFSFGVQPMQNSVVTPKTDNVSTNPFVFGDSLKSESPKVPKRERKDGKLSSLPKWFKADDGKVESSYDMSSKEHGSNGNGITPPGTPKRSQSPRGGHLSPKPMSRSSSPVPIPSRSNILHDSTSSSPQAFGSPRSIGMSPLGKRFYFEMCRSLIADCEQCQELVRIFQHEEARTNPTPALW